MSFNSAFAFNTELISLTEADSKNIYKKLHFLGTTHILNESESTITQKRKSISSDESFKLICLQESSASTMNTTTQCELLFDFSNQGEDTQIAYGAFETIVYGKLMNQEDISKVREIINFAPVYSSMERVTISDPSGNPVTLPRMQIRCSSDSSSCSIMSSNINLD